MSKVIPDDKQPVGNNWPDAQVMVHFCQPEVEEETELDGKLLGSAHHFDIPFEGQLLKGYEWGEGRTVLLIHGWGSRASHLAFLARNLAKSGFKVVAFDGPAHGRSICNKVPPQSSLPEFCRAIYHVTSSLGPVYALIGHSFGATAAAFTAAGQANMAGYRVSTEKLVIISCPPSVKSLIHHYCINQGFEQGAEKIIIHLLEKEFPIKVDEFEVCDALRKISAGVLVVHDKDDEEIAVQEAITMVDGQNNVTYVQTTGEGHRKILASRALLRTVKDFL